MIGFIDLQQAKDQLKITGSNVNSDADIQEKIYEATSIIMEHCEWDTIPDKWMVNSSPLTYDFPYNLIAATKLEMAELFYNREGSASGVLSDAVQRLLRHYRPPPSA